MTEQALVSANTALELQVRNGPEWSPADKVDVVIDFHDAHGQTYRLQIKQQPINTPM